MFTEAYLELSQISTMELFLLRLSHILTMYLICSNCLQVPFFTQLTLSRKKLATLQLLKYQEKKSFVNNGTIFFLKFKIMQQNNVITKNKVFLNQHLLKVLNLLVFVLLSFFIISNIMVKTFLRTAVPYLITKVVRKNKLFI